jgi:hypothetical protein
MERAAPLTVSPRSARVSEIRFGLTGLGEKGSFQRTTQTPVTDSEKDSAGLVRLEGVPRQNAILARFSPVLTVRSLPHFLRE